MADGQYKYNPNSQAVPIKGPEAVDPTTGLIIPAVELDSPLADCFKIYDPERLRDNIRKKNGKSYRTWGGSAHHYTNHHFKMIAVSSKGAGGTGKTTTSWSMGFALAMKNKKVILINLDSQPSTEERCFASIVNKYFDGDLEAFYRSNDLIDQTVLGGLRTIVRFEDQTSNVMQVPRRVVGIDVEKLVSDEQNGQGGSGRLFVMRGDEDISQWEEQLAKAIAFCRMGLRYQERPYGALYHLAQMQAYMLDATYVILDIGPGSGPLLMNAVMSSHFFVIPTGIDQKAASTVRSFAAKIRDWCDENPNDTEQGRESHVSIREFVNKPIKVSGVWENPRFPMPLHQPKLLGVVYSRLGLRGRAHPYNQYAAMSACNQAVTEVLLPALREKGMLLDDHLYDSARGQLPQMFLDYNEGQAVARIKVPAAPPGVACIWVEFGQLQLISERVGIPVFHIPSATWCMRRPKPEMLQHFIESVENGEVPEFSVFAPEVYKACPLNDRKSMGDKVKHLRDILQNLLELLHAGSAEGPGIEEADDPEEDGGPSGSRATSPDAKRRRATLED